jgi:sec-independent protein translocase protein TatB
MIDISFDKLLLLAAVALIVLGPEKLHHVARTAGALLRRMRNGWDGVRAEVERDIQADEIKRNLRAAIERAREPHDQMRAEFNRGFDKVRDTLADAGTLPARPHGETQLIRSEPLASLAHEELQAAVESEAPHVCA